jgi:hypothetical protein
MNAYFEKYSEDSVEVDINIKGCIIPGKMAPGGVKKC